MLVLATPGTAVAASPAPAPSPSAAPGTPVPGELRINEFLPNPVGTDSGSEWIELANVSGRDLAAGGVVVKRLSGSTLATVPAGTTIGAGAVLLLDALSGSIVNGGDTLLLTAGQTELDRVTYDGNGSEGYSWSRLGETEGAWTALPTPGLANPSEIPTGDPDGGGDAGGGGAATAATTRASATTAKSSTATAAKKTSAKKLASAGPAGLAYLLAVGLAMLYWYSRRSPL